MIKTDEELQKTFKITTSESNLIEITYFELESEEDNNARQAEMIVDQSIKLMEADISKKYTILVDLTTAGAIHFIATRARNAYERLARTSNLYKSAVVGKSLFLEVASNLIVQALGRGSNFKWFESVDEAKKWLVES